MIKIKILNPTKDRNEPTFRPFFYIKDMPMRAASKIGPNWALGGPGPGAQNISLGTQGSIKNEN